MPKTGKMQTLNAQSGLSAAGRQPVIIFDVAFGQLHAAVKTQESLPRPEFAIRM